MSRVTPLYVFDDAAEFYQRHSSGVLREFQNESKEIVSFNTRQPKLKTWILAKDYQGSASTYWIFLIRPGEQAEHLFPREGESCDVLLWSKSGLAKRFGKSWEAERIENPAASFGIPEGPAHRMPAFKVKVPNNIPDDILRPLENDPDEVGYDEPSRLTKKYALGDKKAVMVTITLRMSTATKDAEIGAIDKLYKNIAETLSEKQQAAFRYLLAFKQAPFTVNMFNHFPHLRDPINNPGGMPPKVITMLKGFNAHQQAAYKTVLSSLPCGIGILPGGPGAGKTHWNLVVTAAIQSKNIIYHGPDSFSNRSAKVLYILDINKPLDDTCNKIIKLYRSLGLKKYAVRLYGWHYGFRRGKPDFVNKFMFTARLNRYRRHTSSGGCMAPTLDELAWDMYQAGKLTRYRDLYQAVTKSLGGKKDVDALVLKELVNNLYQDVLSRVDFIATTPVPAATGFDGLFKPDIVIFDESPHAREASTMVAIAQYSPIAWIFSGDHRQTRPFVASDDYRDNPWAPQMLVSMMERADRAGAIHHSLLINHRAYGGLQQLASTMFYNKMMITGHKQEELFPPTVQHLQRYLGRFLPSGQTCTEPRLIAYNSNRGEDRIGTSWFNISHIDWVMDRVQELLPDPMFKQVGKNERGTILIISPYKESYMRYRKAIKNLPASWQARLNVEGRCEARTIDTVQGGEADFVFLDMVRSVATDFTDDPNRLNVALTRARQAEIVMMHPDMRRGTYHLGRVFAHVQSLGQVVEINKQRAGPMVQVEGEERAYEQHLAYQQQFDQEREAYGLDRQSSNIQNDSLAPMEMDDSSLANDGQPESIYADQFAGLASLMQGILDDKKAKEKAEQQTRAQTQGQAREKSQEQGRVRPQVPLQVRRLFAGDGSQANGMRADHQPQLQSAFAGPFRENSDDETRPLVRLPTNDTRVPWTGQSKAGGQGTMRVQAQPTASDIHVTRLVQFQETVNGPFTTGVDQSMSQMTITERSVEDPAGVGSTQSGHGLQQSRWSITAQQGTQPAQTTTSYDKRNDRPTQSIVDVNRPGAVLTNAQTSRPLPAAHVLLQASIPTPSRVENREARGGMRQEEATPLPSGSSWW